MSEFIEMREQIAAKSEQLFHIHQTAGEQFDMQKVIDAGLVPGAKNSADVVADIKRRNTELNDLRDKFQPLKEAHDSATLAEEMHKEFNLAVEHKASEGRIEAKTAGRMLVESKEFKAFLAKETKNFSVDLPIEVKTLFQTSAGFAPEAVRSGRVEDLPMLPLAVVDYIPQVAIGQNADVYMEETTATEAAAERDEAGAYAEATFAYTERSQSVRSVGVSLPVTDEQMEDVPGMEATLNARLLLALRRRVDSQVLNGTGVAPLLLGTVNVTGIQTRAQGADNLADALYKILDSIRTDGFADADVIFIRAAKWQTWRLTKTVDGLYVHGSPQDPGPNRIWGLPVVLTNAAPAATAVTGAYRSYSALRTRTGYSIESGYVNDDFTKGKRTIRGGVRVAMVHYRPKAFGTVTALA